MLSAFSTVGSSSLTSAALCVTLGCGNTDTPAPTGYVRIEVETPAEATP